MKLKLGDCLIKPKDDYYNYALRNARINAGYSEEQLASEVGVCGSMISHYERLRALPTPPVVKKLSKVLHRKVREIFPKEMREYIRTGRVRPDNDKEDALDYAQSLSRDDIESLKINEQEPLDIDSRIDLRDNIKKVLRCLSYREREVIKLRYGLGDGYFYTLEEVGHIFRVTRERVRHIENKAVRKLQNPKITANLVRFLD
jgi:RNA polymerase sigma factor (sigma-70 family)